MDTANDEDHLALTESKAGKRVSSAAMARFNLLDRARSLLMKKSHQIHFLEFGGCAVLQKWLMQNPDGSFPPFQVV